MFYVTAHPSFNQSEASLGVSPSACKTVTDRAPAVHSFLERRVKRLKLLVFYLSYTTMREIVHIQAGQCGNQIGAKVCAVRITLLCIIIQGFCYFSLVEIVRLAFNGFVLQVWFI